MSDAGDKIAQCIERHNASVAIALETSRRLHSEREASIHREGETREGNATPSHDSTGKVGA